MSTAFWAILNLLPLKKKEFTECNSKIEKAKTQRKGESVTQQWTSSDKTCYPKEKLFDQNITDLARDFLRKIITF